MTFTQDEAIEVLKKHLTVEKWVKDARENHRVLKALITGDGFKEYLIEHIEYVESSKRAIARKKYSKDIRDLFSRVMSKRKNVFDANGGSENILIKNDTIKETFNKTLSEFKSNKSLYQYLSENYFNLLDTDPNGVIALEYKINEEGFKIYPTYKSIDYIRYYEENGQLVNYIVYEPKMHETLNVQKWRIIDDKTDWTFTQIADDFILDEEKTFEHPFGKPPIIVLSEKEKIGSKIRLSSLDKVLELSKDYARDKSILTIYKFQKGAPMHYRYGSRCKSCSGLGKTGDTTCTTCDGKGYPYKDDVTDMNIIPIPEDGQPVLGDKVAGFVSPDLETWKQYKEDLRDAEKIIEDTIWGTDKTHQSEFKNETATGRFIDTQPISNELNNYTDVVEYVYNTISHWVVNFLDMTKDREEVVYTRSFGRRYIIESPDVLLDKYQQAKEKGDNNTILDKLLQEFILSKYKSDPFMQSKMIKKTQVEPYLHLTIKEVFDFYGAVESNKKVLFQKFWEQADTDKTSEELTEEFNTYFNNNNQIKKDESSSSSE